MADPATALTPAPAGGQQPLALAFVPNAPSFDVLELLPSGQPAERLRALRLRAKESHAIIPPHEDIREASAARTNATSSLKRLLAPAGEGGFRLKPDDPRVVAAQRTLEKATDEFHRLLTRQTERSAVFQLCSQGLAQVEAWLRDGRPSGTVLEAVEVEPPKLLKNEDVLSGIERLRRRCRELKADLHRIESAPYPSSHAKAKMREQIAELATQGAPSVSLLVEHDGKVEFQTQRLQSEVFNAQPGAIGYAAIPDVVGLFAWLHRDALIAALDREIAAEADDKAALSHTDRELRTSETMSDLLSVERDESALVWLAMDQKLPVEHRADCSPQAVLQVQLVTAPRATNGPTSPGHAYDIVLGGRR
jgi:hypothetical protein